jgi:exodeoxyribonuclease VII small subunit
MKATSFEDSLKRLEEIVDILEKGDIPLEESLKLFEEGLKLSKKCNEKLNKVEEKVKVILGKEIKDFEDD